MSVQRTTATGSLPSAAPRLDPLLRAGTRVILTVALRLAYRFRTSGLSHVPWAGGALVVCNHVCFIDWLFVAVALNRTPRFVMHEAHFGSPLFGWFFDLYRVIPIAPRKDNPARLARAMDAIDRALADGELVMMFPEGQMTPDGELSELRPGIERILARRPVPVVPLALRGLYGSFFSRAGGEPMRKLPRRFRAPIELVAGPPIPAERFSTEALRDRLLELRGDAR